VRDLYESAHILSRRIGGAGNLRGYVDYLAVGSGGARSTNGPRPDTYLDGIDHDRGYGG
jgi:hypothetical protein